MQEDDYSVWLLNLLNSFTLSDNPLSSHDYYGTVGFEARIVPAMIMLLFVLLTWARVEQDKRWGGRDED
jgi:hypothetical protein